MNRAFHILGFSNEVGLLQGSEPHCLGPPHSSKFLQGTFKSHSGSAYQKGHMRKEPEMHPISLGRNSQLGTLSCSMEPCITGHFLELGWGPAVLRSNVREGGVDTGSIQQDGMRSQACI